MAAVAAVAATGWRRRRHSYLLLLKLHQSVTRQRGGQRTPFDASCCRQKVWRCFSLISKYYSILVAKLGG